MAVKTVEEIKAEVTVLVKSQGNQGAISLGTVLDDITELAGEGGGGGGGVVIPVDVNLAEASGMTTFTPEQLAQVVDGIKSSATVTYFKVMQPSAPPPLNAVENYVTAYLISQPAGDVILCDASMQYGETTYKGIGIVVSTAAVQLVSAN